ncbi:uncharacterized protein LOC111639255 [Centruroides sculpturatus]|uniref:uncharacterized protein LOC111639255 n=1 Tax=Centruroides sculpturatus TaxID=218467 RepID=UPI000C6EC257|nr:uncharacterized protein LOC111639255 [Centruroides sculpturatus]
MSDSIEMGEETVSLTRHNAARCTVARRCREFYLRRLERTEIMKRRWSMCTVEENDKIITPKKTSSTPDITESVEQLDVDGKECLDSYNERCSLDLAMKCLRQEITSLVSQDNDLFRQLLTLHDSIAELREKHNSVMITCLNEEPDTSHSPSWESLSDTDHTMSPTSTLSSCSSQSQSMISFGTPGGMRRHTTTETDYNVCMRCRTGSKGAPPRRRSVHHIYTLDDIDSYDSGVQLHGCHSDSDHEIFV